MNYIHALQGDVAELQRRLDAAQAALDKFRIHLAGENFEVVISIAAVNRWLDTIQYAIQSTS